jgi:hypothetical protein
MVVSFLISIETAEEILNEAAEINPGPWVMHSQYVGLAAKNIAEACPHLDSEKAYILGLLHDIGRRCGITNMRHSIDGYHFCKEKGLHDAARICLTHSFPYKYIREAFGKWDCTDAEYRFAADFIQTVEYDDYDLLIQLCDALALPSGFSLLEKRMIDVALRHGIHEYIIPKWKKTFEIKGYFDLAAGRNIYDLLPGIVENTFA